MGCVPAWKPDSLLPRIMSYSAFYLLMSSQPPCSLCHPDRSDGMCFKSCSCFELW